MLDEMRAFSIFAEVGSVQAAAGRLHLTQSAVTRQIKRLEEELGTALLDRRFKPPILTSSGSTALEECRTILRDVANLKANLSPTREPAGKFRIGVGYVLADDEFIACLHEVKVRFPQIELNIRTDWHHALVEMVRENQVDVAIIPKHAELPLPPGVKGKVVGTEPLVFVVGARAIRGKRPSIAELGRLPWIAKPRGTGTREVLEAFLAGNELPFELASEVRDENLQLSLVARGLGVALVTNRSARRHSRSRSLRVVKLTAQALKLDIMVVRGAYVGCLEPAIDMLAEHLSAKLVRQARS
jgi:DNA-binding transcriptional LysR family regulator